MTTPTGPMRPTEAAQLCSNILQIARPQVEDQDIMPLAELMAMAQAYALLAIAGQVRRVADALWTERP